MSNRGQPQALVRLRPYLGVLAFMAALTLVPHVGLASRQVHLAVVALIWSMAVYGLLIPYGFAGLITVAVAAVWGVGAFSAGLAVKYWNWGFVPSVLLAAVAAALAGFVLALPVLRTKGHYFVIVTFVLAQALTVAAGNWDVTLGPNASGITVTAPLAVGPWSFTKRQDVFYLCLAVVTAMAVLATFLRNSYLGQLFAGVRENEELARSIGIETTNLKLLALAIGGAFAGVGGAFYVFYLHHIDVHAFGIGQAMTIVLMLIVGGSRSILGPVVGAGVVYYIPEVIRLSPVYQQIVFGIVLAAIVLVLPGGLLGSWGRGPLRTLRARRRRAETAPETAAEAPEPDRVLA